VEKLKCAGLRDADRLAGYPVTVEVFVMMQNAQAGLLLPVRLRTTSIRFTGLQGLTGI